MYAWINRLKTVIWNTNPSAGIEWFSLYGVVPTTARPVPACFASEMDSPDNFKDFFFWVHPKIMIIEKTVALWNCCKISEVLENHVINKQSLILNTSTRVCISNNSLHVKFIVNLTQNVKRNVKLILNVKGIANLTCIKCEIMTIRFVFYGKLTIHFKMMNPLFNNCEMNCHLAIPCHKQRVSVSESQVDVVISHFF